MERVWLKGRPFVAGSEISIADLLYASELDMLRMLETVPEVGAWQHWHASWQCAWPGLMAVPGVMGLCTTLKGCFCGRSLCQLRGSLCANHMLSVQPSLFEHGWVTS